jgi:hypothetical protein
MFFKGEFVWVAQFSLSRRTEGDVDLCRTAFGDVELSLPWLLREKKVRWRLSFRPVIPRRYSLASMFEFGTT